MIWSIENLYWLRNTSKYGIACLFEMTEEKKMLSKFLWNFKSKHKTNILHAAYFHRSQLITNSHLFSETF